MISLKVLVDKEKNRVIFAESDEDFIDVLFSFLTLPLGTIIRRVFRLPPAKGRVCTFGNTPDQSQTVRIGCMTNLYESIKNLDMQYFRTEACKTMLLYPRNFAAAQCERLKLRIDDGGRLRYFLCSNNCALSLYKLLSLYRSDICECGKRMELEMQLSRSDEPMLTSDVPQRGVFVKGPNLFIISDELQVKPSSKEESFSQLSKLGFMDSSAIEECNFNLGVHEVLTLLKCSIVSKKPLTETLLKHNSVPELSREDFEQGSYKKPRIEEPGSNAKGKIHVKLIVSKSKKIVCYAEASEDFVDLLSSFLTVPLGYIVKKMQSNISKSSINHIYNSVLELDTEKYLKSDEHKTMLVSPKLAPHFSYKNHPLDIEEDSHPPYYISETAPAFSPSNCKLTSNVSYYSGSNVRRSSVLTIKDPKSHFKEVTTKGGGFLRGPAMFTVTDDLIITPISQVSNLSLLIKLRVPFSDIEERVVEVGDGEAMRLLVASFVTESALTNALLGEPKPE